MAADVLPPARFGDWILEECARDSVSPELAPIILWDTWRPGRWPLFPAEVVDEVFDDVESVQTFHPAWRTETVVVLAEAIYADHAFDRLPVLADALEEAGCDDDRLLGHCRQDGWHVRGCWAVDAVLGKG